MKKISEGALQITFPDNVIIKKHDDQNHGLSHCMKSVDFIVEFEDKTWFIELKDPDNSATPAQNREEYIENFKAGKIDEDLKIKYRDSFLYEFALGRADKPIYYFVLIGATKLDSAVLLSRTETLKKLIPINGPKSIPWQRPIVKNCAVLNIESWNRIFTDITVARV